MPKREDGTAILHEKAPDYLKDGTLWGHEMELPVVFSRPALVAIFGCAIDSTQRG